MKLHEITPTPGSTRPKKRVGRGDKTATRGENGQKSRSGYSKKIGFEGGQNPLYKTLPKRGFHNFNHKEYTIVNLKDLSKVSNSKITPQSLVDAKIIKKNYGEIKILGDGEITKKISVEAHKFSKKAQELIEKKGGKVILISSKKKI